MCPLLKEKINAIRVKTKLTAKCKLIYETLGNKPHTPKKQSKIERKIKKKKEKKKEKSHIFDQI